jgi:2-oxoglutarate ferredoxin oxidoreductase subunit beta
MQRTLPELGVLPENTVFISGIGCSSRFPYYMNTYGFHTIHGRAPGVATGVKLANPELDVWLITGDGDGLSIGGNHMMHVLRRNLDISILLFNNRIYGLTKGQYSPTSGTGLKSPSTPDGSIDLPILPAALALGAGSHFVARSVDTSAKHLAGVFKRAHEHRGSSFVEILQNCVVFYDGAWDHVTQKDVSSDHQILLEHGQPMVYGANRDKGLRIKPGRLEIESVVIGENGVTVDDLLVHDEGNRNLAFLLAGLEPPHFPIALGVLYAQSAPTYEAMMAAQMNAAAKKMGDGDLDALLRQGDTWVVS